MHYIKEDNTLINSADVKSCSKAKGILNKISHFKFVMGFITWYDILYEINISRKYLQSPSLNL